MSTIGIVTIVAALAFGLARRLRLPAEALAIIAGVLLDALPIPLDGELARSALFLSATFLVFSVGADVDRAHVTRFRRGAIAIVALHVALTGAIVAAVAPLLAMDVTTLAYLTLALAGSSTLLVRDLLRRRERVHEPLGRLVTAIVVVQDVAVVIALSLLAPAGDEGARSLLGSIGACVGLAVASGLVARFVAPRMFVESRLGEEERLLAVLAILFAFTAAAALFGLPLVAGAYFAGLALSRFPVSGEVRGHLAPFADFFRALFFVLLGVVATLPDPTELLVEAALIGTVLLLRPIVLVPLVRATGLTVRSTVEAVTLLAQSGELALVVVLVGVERGQLDERMLAIVVAVVVVTMSVVRWVSSDRVTWQLTRRYPWRRRRPAVDAREHIVLIGGGETGRAVLERLGEGARVVIVDDDPAVVAGLEADGWTVLRGNGSEPATLRAAGVSRAAAVVSTMRYQSDNARLIELARGRPVLVRVFSEAEAEGIRALGGHAVVEAELAAEAFLAWLDREGAAAPAPPPR